MIKQSDPSITIRDVAREAGVSVATVSRYLNQNAPVSEKLSVRIQEVMDELDYVPQETARQLAKRQKNAVGLLLTDFYSDFFGPLLVGVEKVVQEEGYNLLVATHHPVESPEQQLPLGRHNTDGLLAFVDSLSEKQIRRFHEKQFPLVLIHQSPKNGEKIPFVTVENKAATYEMVNHLITQHNRRRIIFLRGPENQEDSHWREIGYRQALFEHQIPIDESLIFTGYFQRHRAYQEMTAFMNQPNHPEFDAVFAGDDSAAIGVYDALAESELNVPEDVSVVGFDDTRMAPFLNPPLTTVQAPTKEVGRSAAQQLFYLLAGKQPQLETLHPTKIVIRRSCGCHNGSSEQK